MTCPHWALFKIGLVQAGVSTEIARAFRRAQGQALERLYARIGRLKNVGRLGRAARRRRPSSFTCCAKVWLPWRCAASCTRAKPSRSGVTRSEH
jgi:hypothetical protein